MWPIPMLSDFKLLFPMALIQIYPFLNWIQDNAKAFCNCFVRMSFFKNILYNLLLRFIRIYFCPHKNSPPLVDFTVQPLGAFQKHLYDSWRLFLALLFSLKFQKRFVGIAAFILVRENIKNDNSIFICALSALHLYVRLFDNGNMKLFNIY